jgi:hypothetical protein
MFAEEKVWKNDLLRPTTEKMRIRTPKRILFPRTGLFKPNIPTRSVLIAATFLPVKNFNFLS